jgi:hypothetical protein
LPGVNIMFNYYFSAEKISFSWKTIIR